MRNVIEINPDWLLELAPHYYNENDVRDTSKKIKMPKGKGAS